MAQLTCKNLTLGYDNRAIQEDLNFSIDAGDYLCIVGENGSGKSTLMKTLLHLQAPISGSIELGDGLKEKIERIRTEGSQVTEEMIARIAGLKQKYREAGKLELFSNRRLLKAFPKLESHDYKDQLEELKRQLEKLSENEK